MRFTRSLLIFLTFLATGLADVEFTVPSTGSVFRASDIVTAIWRESGSGPRISALTEYDLYLCAGGDKADSYEEVSTLLRNVAFSRGNSVSFKIDPEAGGNEVNAYFLKMVSSGAEIPVVNHSPRFTLTHMTGSFSPNVLHGLDAMLDPNDPTFGEGEEELRKRQAGVGPGGAGLGAGAGVGAGAGAAAGVKGYTVPYNLQTGPTRYAPMAKKPGTSITARTASPQYPTSDYQVATTYLPPATVEITVTAPRTYSTSSIENTASPAPQPDDAKMKKFLERWKD